MANQNSKPKKGEAQAKIDIDGDVDETVIVTGSGNTIHTGKSKLDSWQTIAIIFVLLLVVVVIVMVSSSSLPSLNGTAGSETPTLVPTSSPIPTDTVVPSEPTSTFTPTANIATETFTPIPPVPLGEDWTQGCISKLWSTYPSTVQTEDRNDGCWKEPIHAFSAENGELKFLYERASGAEEIYGLFAPLPTESGSLTLTIRLRDLSNADLLIGIFSQPEVKSPGLLMMMLNGGVDSNVFIQKDPFTYETILGSQKIYQGTGYSITFHFDNLSVRSIVNPSVFFIDPFSLPASQKYLFLGYKGLRGYYRIEGTFLSFELKE